MNEISIFIFRRDLRIKDNISLNKCYDESKKIILLFIFDPKQIENNKYASKKAITFMLDSLLDLQLSVGSKLEIKYGKPHNIIANMLGENEKISAVYVSADYTPYSRKRDGKIEKICKQNDVSFNAIHDILLLGSLKYNKSGKPYKVFTAFYNAYKKKEIGDPTSRKITSKLLSVKSSPSDIKKYKNDEMGDQKGGRTEGLKLLHNIKNANKYSENKDILSESTTRISSHVNFGTISIREVYREAKKITDKTSKQAFIRQLFWRDFYMNIINTEDDLGAYDDKWKIEWHKNTDWLNAWKSGNTGFPIVDAAMRELNATGFMHNRCRMIVSSFLSKDLSLDWREGEKYFSTKLTDISLVMNNMNWQNVVGCGPSAQPYFRVFNPWQQSVKYDYECIYIKKWIPELKNIPNTSIHNWFDKYKEHPKIYFKPILNHGKAKEKYLEWIKKKLIN